MINSQMRFYDYLLFGEDNGYDQASLSNEVKGSVKMAINTTSTTIQDNIKYKDASYIGLTYNSLLDDSMVIQYGKEKLKVLYVIPKGRLKQVFLKEI